MGLAWYGTNTNLINDHEPYAGIHTIFFWDCLVQGTETNNFTIGRANKHHGELAYVRKHTWWSNTTMSDDNVIKSTELSSVMHQDHQDNILQNNEFIDSREYIHIWMRLIRFHTLCRDQYTEAYIAWITVSYTRVSFIPIIYSTVLSGDRFWSFSSHHQLWPEYTKRILLFLASL